MKNQTPTLEWATNYLTSNGYIAQHPPEIIVETPWSNVVRFPTSKEDVYLKQMPPAISIEAKIIQLLATQFHARVPTVIANNDDLHCFLMRDAGQTLRKYLKTEAPADLLGEAIRQFTTIQRSTENHIESFFALGVPDWRLDKLPHLYNEITDQTDLLKSEGITEKEQLLLRSLSPKIAEQCDLLSQYQIPETLVQPDFNTNNILIDPNTKNMTLIDLGEIAIAHPFFSLHNFLFQATIHHGVKDSDQTYHQLQNVCFENWLKSATKNELLEAFAITKKLWPIYSALAYYRLMISVGQKELKFFYSNRPNRLAGYFREYAAENST